ncbi:MAG: sugar transferase, partial [Ignavibacteriae bacterium]|nr:sugar transferase [Ignavibacteriota bacterium]
VSQCQGENVNFMMSGSELDFMVGKSNITHIDNVPLLKVQYNISMFTHKFIKRFFDLVLSTFLIIFVFPFGWLYSKISNQTSEFVKMIVQLPIVFIGRKSFVGPKNQNYYEELFLGKLGITGFWFIDNLEDADLEENNRINLFYAKNQNIWLDLEILGKTFAKMF